MKAWLAVAIVWALGGNPNEGQLLAVPIPFPSKAVCEQFLASPAFAAALADLKAEKRAAGTPIEAKTECQEI